MNMKKIMYLLAGLLLFTGITSCEDRFEEANTNHNKIYTVRLQDVFPGTIYKSIDCMAEMNYNYFMWFSRYSFLTFRGPSDKDNTSGSFNKMYIDVLKNLQIGIDREKDIPEAVNIVQIAQIWKAYLYYFMASSFGPMPMQDALNADLNEYRYDSEESIYTAVLNMLDDAKFLAENSQNKNAIKTNLFCWAYIYFSEKNYSQALTVLKQARTIQSDNTIINIKVMDLIGRIDSLELDHSEITLDTDIEKPLVALLNVARTLAAETSLELLLKTVAQEIKKVLDADRCTVFLLDKNKNELVSKIALGMGTQELRFPADKGLAGYVAQSGEIINIKDAYSDSRFNQEIDKETGYKTQTILCMPIWNMKHEILGVFQVLNKNNAVFTTYQGTSLDGRHIVCFGRTYVFCQPFLVWPGRGVF